MPQVDELSVKVNSDAKSAYAQLDAVVEKLSKINNALSNIKNNNGLKNIADFGQMFNGVSQNAEREMQRTYTTTRSYVRRIKQELSSTSDHKGAIPKAQQQQLGNLLGESKSFAQDRAQQLIDYLGVKDPKSVQIIQDGFKDIYQKAFDNMASGTNPSSKLVNDTFDKIFDRANRYATNAQIATQEWKDLYDAILSVNKMRVPKEIFSDNVLGKSKHGALLPRLTSQEGYRGIDSYFAEWMNSPLRSTIESFNSAHNNEFNLDNPTDQARMLDMFLKDCQRTSELIQTNMFDVKRESNTFFDAFVENMGKYLKIRKTAGDYEKEIRASYGKGLADTYKDFYKDSSAEQLRNSLRNLTKTYAETTEAKERMEREGTYDTRTYANTVENLIRLEEQRKAITDKLSSSQKGLEGMRMYVDGQDVTGDGKQVPRAKISYDTFAEPNKAITFTAEDFAPQIVAQLEQIQEASQEMWRTANEDISNSINTVQSKASEFAQALDSIRPNINVEDFKDNVYSLEKTFDGLVAKEEEIKQRMADFKLLPNANENTQQFQKMEIQLAQVRANIAELADEYWRLKDIGGFEINITPFEQAVAKVKADVSGLKEHMRNAKLIIPTDALKQTEQQIEATRKKIESINAYIAKKSQTTPYYGASQDYKNQTAELDRLIAKYDELIAKKEQLYQSGGFKVDFSAISKGLNGVAQTLGKVDSVINKVGRGFLSLAGKVKSSISPMRAIAKQSNNLTQIGNALSKSFLKVGNMFKLMLTRMAMRAVIKDVGEAFNSLTQYCDSFNANVSMLWNSLKQLANAIASVADPILAILAPALNYIIQVIISVVNAINQLLSALSGATVWHKAKKQVGDYGKAVSGADKATKGALQSFDELNNITINEGGGGGSSAVNPSDLWEDSEIDPRWKKIADWLKQLAKDLFAPIKEAWDRVKTYMVESFKFTVSQILKLLSDIGKDFMTMWGQENTVKVFEGIFLIIGNIVEAVGWLAHNLDEAWNYNKNGLHILETIRDIILIIVSHLLKMAYATKVWAKQLSFKPLFASVLKYLRSLRAVVDAIMGVFEGFYIKVLLPLGKWTIEKGIPELLNIFSDFNDKVDWYAIENNFNRLWEAVEPFAETIGEGLLLFIDKLTNVVADFLNSDFFKKIVDGFKQWSEGISAEDVCRTIEQIIGAIILLKGTILGLKGASGVFSVLATIMQSGLGEILIAIAPVVGAIAGIGIVLVGAYNSSESFRTSVKNLADAIKDSLPSFDEMCSLFGELGDNADKLFEQLGNLASKIIDDLTPYIVNLFGELEGDIKILSDVIDFLGDLLEILNKVYNIMRDIKNLDFGKAIQDFKELDGLHFDSGKKLAKDFIGTKVPIIGNAFDFFDKAKTQNIKPSDYKFDFGAVKDAVPIVSDILFGTSFSKGKTSDKTDATVTVGIDVRGDEAVKNAGETVEKIADTCLKEAPELKIHTDIDTESMRGMVNGAFDDIINASQSANLGELFDTSKIGDFSNQAVQSANNIKKATDDATQSSKDFKLQSFSAFLDVKNNSTDLATTYKENTSSMTKGTENVVVGLKKLNTDGAKQVSDFRKNIEKAFDGIGSIFEKIGKKISSLLTGITGLNNSKVNVNVGTSTSSSGKSTSSVGSFASGGFPMSGQMFLARENGIPELIGSIGHQTTVANNMQIIQGITDGVEAGNEQGNIYMSSMVNLLQTIADKPSGITNADIFNSVRNSSRMYKRSTGHSAF